MEIVKKRRKKGTNLQSREWTILARLYSEKLQLRAFVLSLYEEISSSSFDDKKLFIQEC